MFHLLSKPLPHSTNRHCISSQLTSMAIQLSLRYLSTNPNPNSFTVSYLITKCGLSPESALSASKSLQLKTPINPDSVRSFLKSHGFSNPQITEIVRKYPRTLSCNVAKVISPKFDFFRSKGASKSDIVTIFTRYPWIIRRSLENYLIPAFDYFAELLKSEDKALAAVKRCPRVLFTRLEAQVIPNINTLRDNGVPVANVLLLVEYQPQYIEMNCARFEAIVEEVRKLGFDPLKSQFVSAIVSLGSLSKSGRDRKFGVYRRWGWSKRDTVSAFKRSPCCLAISEAKIMAVMDFYVNQLGLDCSVLKRRPKLLSLSLQKRLIPRAAVLQHLETRGVLKLDSRVTCWFEYTEKHFLEKMVNCREDKEYLLKLYNEKLNC